MKYITFTEEGKKKIESLPHVIKYAVKYLADALNQLVNGDCSEEQILSSVGTLKQNAEGRVNNDDVLNYDQACKMLGLSVTNRVGLRRLLDKNNIHQVIINNHCCGFLRSEISALSDKLDKDIKKREKARQNRAKRLISKNKHEW